MLEKRCVAEESIEIIGMPTEAPGTEEASQEGYKLRRAAHKQLPRPVGEKIEILRALLLFDCRLTVPDMVLRFILMATRGLIGPQGLSSLPFHRLGN